jgi:Mrp family chromosome partitioning ATPase
MNWFLVALAEIWRWRWGVALPTVLGCAVAGWFCAITPPQFIGSVLLQLQAEQARAPLLQKISAPGHREALLNALLNPEVLSDASRDAGQPINPRNIRLAILNDNLIELSYLSSTPEGLPRKIEALGYNFIQAILAPERMRVEQLLADAQDDLSRISNEAILPNSPASLQRTKIESAIVQYQSDLRLLNGAFGPQGSQVLLWFAETAQVSEPLTDPLRWLGWLVFGGLAGFMFGWLTAIFPNRLRMVVRTEQDVKDATGLSVVGILPWLNGLQAGPSGHVVSAGGKALRPSEFSEISRLQRTATRGLRGPLVLVGPVGQEGTSALALLLAEKSARLGKTTLLVDLNLKNRTLSHWLQLGEGAWNIPGGRGKWSALKTLNTGVEGSKLMALAAPKHNATLQALGEAGGLPALIETLNQQGETIIIDATPINAFNRGNIDALSLAVLAGRVLLVAQQGVTTKADLQRGCEALLLAGAPVLGVVLNQQFHPTRRQLLGQLADYLSWVLPPLGRTLRQATFNARLE